WSSPAVPAQCPRCPTSPFDRVGEIAGNAGAGTPPPRQAILPTLQAVVGAPVQSVDLIIADIAWLITMDSGRRVIRDAAVAGDRGKVVAVGKVGDIRARYNGKSNVDGSDTVATPGFVDCHLHSSFQLSRGLADEANAQSFLFDRMYPYEAALDSDDV